MTGRLDGKVTLITGSTFGIGRTCASVFAQEGARVVVNGRHAERGQETVNQILEAGGQAIFEQADLLSYSECASMIERVLDRWGQIDVLLNSGRPRSPGEQANLFAQSNPENFMTTFRDSLISRMWCIHSVIGHMVERKTGSIINITTDAGRTPTPAQTILGSAAASLIFFSRALAKEVSRQKIRVNTLSVTLTKDTPPWEAYQKRVQAGSQDILVKAFRKIEEQTPFGLTEPLDIAQAALFLASDESKQISGAVLSVNGGISFPA